MQLSRDAIQRMVGHTGGGVSVGGGGGEGGGDSGGGAESDESGGLDSEILNSDVSPE